MILDNFPQILWINLDRSIARREHMEKLLTDYNLTHQRIQATDGKNDRRGLLELCRINPKLTLLENAVTCSHLRAVKYFLEETQEDRIVIMEDDVSFEYLKYIPFDWSEVESCFPANYSIIQLASSKAKTIYPRKIDQPRKLPCAAAYLISRNGAQEIVSKCYDSQLNKFDLSKFSREYAVADALIYNVKVAWSVPIFTYQANDSVVHPKFVDHHVKRKNLITRLWKGFAKYPKKTAYLTKFQGMN